jgi:hypothetical protein
MHDAGLLAQLPETYAAVLRLREQGLDEPAIAAALSVDAEAVGPLLQVADAKLAALRERTGDPH